MKQIGNIMCLIQLQTMTEAELNTKVLAMHSENAMQIPNDDGEMRDMTDDEVTAISFLIGLQLGHN